MLQVSRVSVAYGGKTVLHEVDLRLEEGQWLMLVGPNGAGKTTLVSAISQMVPYEGRVKVLGSDARRLKPRELARRLGVLAQRRHVAYAFTVEELVCLGRYAHRGGLFGQDDVKGTDRVEQALAMTGMSELRQHSVMTLSGGELQRAFLSQVFAQDPSILLLDEPANHLDPMHQKAVFSLIGRWLKEGGHAAVSVVHDLSIARMYGTHALILSQGQTVASGRSEAVLSNAYLERAYGMDVVRWMQKMLSQWKESS